MLLIMSSIAGNEEVLSKAMVEAADIHEYFMSEGGFNSDTNQILISVI